MKTFTLKTYHDMQWVKKDYKVKHFTQAWKCLYSDYATIHQTLEKNAKTRVC